MAKEKELWLIGGPIASGKTTFCHEQVLEKQAYHVDRDPIYYKLGNGERGYKWWDWDDRGPYIEEEAKEIIKRYNNVMEQEIKSDKPLILIEDCFYNPAIAEKWIEKGLEEGRKIKLIMFSARDVRASLARYFERSFADKDMSETGMFLEKFYPPEHAERQLKIEKQIVPAFDHYLELAAEGKIELELRENSFSSDQATQKQILVAQADKDGFQIHNDTAYKFFRIKEKISLPAALDLKLDWDYTSPSYSGFEVRQSFHSFFENLTHQETEMLKRSGFPNFRLPQYISPLSPPGGSPTR